MWLELRDSWACPYLGIAGFHGNAHTIVSAGNTPGSHLVQPQWGPPASTWQDEQAYSHRLLPEPDLQRLPLSPEPAHVPRRCLRVLAHRQDTTLSASSLPMSHPSGPQALWWPMCQNALAMPLPPRGYRPLFVRLVCRWYQVPCVPDYSGGSRRWGQGVTHFFLGLPCDKAGPLPVSPTLQDHLIDTSWWEKR
jgi:hypothetical protein